MFDLQFVGFSIMNMFSSFIIKLVDFIITNKYLNLDMGWIVTFSM
jgi:hypothetical protein